MADVNYYLGPWIRGDFPLRAWTAPSGTVGLLDFGSLLDCALSPNVETQRGIGLFCTPRGIILPSEYALLDSGDGREIAITSRHRDIVESVLGVRIDVGHTLAEGLGELFAAGDPTGQERWRPLTPTQEGEYEIHLGGHSKIWSRKFDGPADKTWNRLRDLLRNDLQQHDTECQAESKRLKDLAKELRKQSRVKEADRYDALSTVIERHAEKVLDAMVRKYRCLPSELSTEIRRGRATTTLTESFNTSDGDTLGPDQSWTEVNGDWDISGNAALVGIGSTFCDAKCNTPLSSGDNYCQLSLTAASEGAANHQVGPATRLSSTGWTGYCASTLFFYSPDYFWIDKHTGPTARTLLAGVEENVTRPSTVRVAANGSSISILKGGVSKQTTTDSAYTGTYAGFWGYRDSDAIGPKIDDWEASDGISAGSAIPVLMAQYRQRR